MNQPYSQLAIFGDLYFLVKMWRLWAKALGEKVGNSDREADRVALIRTVIVITATITNLIIVAGVIRHW
jgi:hypothetical protein